MPPNPPRVVCFSICFKLALPKKLRWEKMLKLGPPPPFKISRYATAGPEIESSLPRR